MRDPPVYLTDVQVAGWLQITPRVVNTMRRLGQLPGIKLGRVWRYRQTEVSAVLNAMHRWQKRKVTTT